MKRKLIEGYDWILFIIGMLFCFYWLLGTVGVNVPLHEGIAICTRGIFGASAPIVPILGAVLVLNCIIALETSDQSAWKQVGRIFVWECVLIVSMATFFYILANQGDLHSLSWAFEKGVYSFFGGVIGYLGAEISLLILPPSLAMAVWVIFFGIGILKLFRKRRAEKITPREWKHFGMEFFKNPVRALKLEPDVK